MLHHPRIVRCAAYILPALCISFLLYSCKPYKGLIGSSGQATVPTLKASVPYSIVASHLLRDSSWNISFDPAITHSPEGGITIFRRIGEDLCAAEHYTRDSFALDWSVSLPIREDETFEPAIKYSGGKLYCAGVDSYADVDSISFRVLVIDPAARRIESDRRTFRDADDYSSITHKAKRSGYYVARSDDSSLFLLYTDDIVNDDEKSSGHALIARCHIFDITGKELGAPSFTLPLPEHYKDLDNSGLQDVKIANDGSIYAWVKRANDIIEIARYPDLGAGKPEILRVSFSSADFPADDFSIAEECWQIDPKTSRVDLAGSHRKGTDGELMKDMLYASLDFRTKEIRTGQYKPPKDTIDAFLDQSDFENCVLRKIMHDEVSGKTILVIHKASLNTVVTYNPNMDRQYRWVPSGSRLNKNICKGFAVFGFDRDGKLAFQYGLPSHAGNTSMFSLLDPVNGKAGLYYVDDDITPVGLYYRSIDMASGALSSPFHIYATEKSSYSLLRYTQWENPKSAVMFASGFTFSKAYTLLRNPTIFRLNMP